jgi:hypothetical protein
LYHHAYYNSPFVPPCLLQYAYYNSLASTCFEPPCHSWTHYTFCGAHTWTVDEFRQTNPASHPTFFSYTPEYTQTLVLCAFCDFDEYLYNSDALFFLFGFRFTRRRSKHVRFCSVKPFLICFKGNVKKRRCKKNYRHDCARNDGVNQDNSMD